MLISTSNSDRRLSASVLAARTSLLGDTCCGKSSMFLWTEAQEAGTTTGGWGQRGQQGSDSQTVRILISEVYCPLCKALFIDYFDQHFTINTQSISFIKLQFSTKCLLTADFSRPAVSISVTRTHNRHISQYSFRILLGLSPESDHDLFSYLANFRDLITDWTQLSDSK